MGHATGASMAPDVLNDLAAIPGVLHQNAAIKHNKNIDSIKTAYDIDFTPNKVPVGSTNSGPVTANVVGKGPHTFPNQAALDAFKQAGGKVE